LKDKISSNKIGRCVKITHTHTIKTLVPTKYDMEVANYYDFNLGLATKVGAR
jgi:hypothetical protein